MIGCRTSTVDELKLIENHQKWLQPNEVNMLTYVRVQDHNSSTRVISQCPHKLISPGVSSLSCNFDTHPPLLPRLGSSMCSHTLIAPPPSQFPLLHLFLISSFFHPFLIPSFFHPSPIPSSLIPLSFPSSLLSSLIPSFFHFVRYSAKTCCGVGGQLWQHSST